MLQYSKQLGVAIEEVTGCCNTESDRVLQYSKLQGVAIQQVTGCHNTASDRVLQYSKLLGVAIQQVTWCCNTASDTGCCTPQFSPGNSRHLAKGGAVQLILAAV